MTKACALDCELILQPLYAQDNTQPTALQWPGLKSTFLLELKQWLPNLLTSTYKNQESGPSDLSRCSQTFYPPAGTKLSPA